MVVIRKMLMVAERGFRRLKAPRLVMDVYPGAQDTYGLLVASGTEGSPPDPAYTRFDVNSGRKSHCPTRRDLSTVECVIAHLRHRILECTHPCPDAQMNGCMIALRGRRRNERGDSR